MFSEDSVFLKPPVGTIAAVPGNDSREAGLKFCERNMLFQLFTLSDGDTDWRSRGVLLVQAGISTAKNRRVLTPGEQDAFRKLNKETLKATGNLVCVLGASNLVTSNTNVSKGVANGTSSSLQDIILHDSAIIRIVHLSASTSVHAVFAEDVKCLIMKHQLGEWKNRKLFESLPTGCFPIVPLKSSFKRSLEGIRRTINVVQFPCVLSLILTGHKVQGQSLESIILGGLSKPHKFGRQGWLYVVLSRVRTLAGLFTLVKLESNPKRYMPRLDVMAEMKRLNKIEICTVQRLNLANINNAIF